MTIDSNDYPLYDQAISGNFTTVEKRAITHPHEAEFQDDNGYTVLHRLAYAPEVSIAVIKSVARAYPPALQIRNRNGKTPLDIAKRYKATSEIVEFLKVYEGTWKKENAVNVQRRLNKILYENNELRRKMSLLNDDCSRLQQENEFLKDGGKSKEFATPFIPELRLAKSTNCSKFNEDGENHGNLKKTVEDLRQELSVVKRNADIECQKRINEKTKEDHEQQTFVSNMRQDIYRALNDNIAAFQSRRSVEQRDEKVGYNRSKKLTPVRVTKDSVSVDETPDHEDGIKRTRSDDSRTLPKKKCARYDVYSERDI